MIPGRPRRGCRRHAVRIPRAGRARPAEPTPVPSPRALRARRVALVALAGGLAFLPLTFAARKLAAHPALAVRAVTVHGAHHASPEEIRELSGIDAQTSWVALDARAASVRLESHPWVARARVLRPWPGRVRILVRECEPVARIEVARRTYGLCRDLRIVPTGAEELPLVRCRSREGTDPEALRRGLDYLAALRSAGIAGREPVELELNRRDGDRIALPERGFAAAVEEPMLAREAVRDIVAFLETLDGEGGSRGTLRLVSSGTGVWRASGGRPLGAG